uniref:SJCHGC01171 protein n=1 Tax=Schistosoma japonicum TaxID=6182 RepID=Q5D8F1_SCHJA|nr:SJCHGC01171 protein [Schistosoma japonicum]
MMSIILCLIILSYIISFALMELIVEPLVVWKYGKNRNDGYVVVTDVNNHNDNDNDDDDADADADVTVMNKDNFIGNDVCVNKFDDIRDDKINVDEAGCGENEENIDNEGENDEVRDNDGDDGNEYGDVAIDIDEDVAINTYSDFIDNNADAGTVVVDTVAVAAGDGFDSHVDIVSSNGDVVIDIDKSVDACSDYDASAAASAAVAAHYDDVDYDGNVSKKFRWKVFRYFCCC